MVDSIVIKTVSTPPQNLKGQVRRLLAEGFAWEATMTTAQKLEYQDRFCSKKDIFGYVLALENKEVIGIAIVLKRALIYKTQAIMLGGIGGMCTRKDKQRQGIATRLLTQAMKELRQAHCDIAYICTNIKSPWMVNFYGKVGFVPLGRSHTYLGKSGKRYYGHDAMIAAVNSQKLFQLVISQKSAFDIGVGNW